MLLDFYFSQIVHFSVAAQSKKRCISETLIKLKLSPFFDGRFIVWDFKRRVKNAVSQIAPKEIKAGGNPLKQAVFVLDNADRPAFSQVGISAKAVTKMGTAVLLKTQLSWSGP